MANESSTKFPVPSEADFREKIINGDPMFYQYTGYNRPLMTEEMFRLSVKQIASCAVVYMYGDDDEKIEFTVTDKMVSSWFSYLKGKLADMLDEARVCNTLLMQNLAPDYFRLKEPV